MKLIGIVRDGRDTTLSLQKVGWHPENFAFNALFWCKTAQRVLELERTWPADQFLRVHFEDLIRDPRPVLERICAFIDEPFHADMLDDSLPVATVPDWERDWKGNSQGPPDPSRIGRWRACSPRDRDMLNGFLGPELRRLGYADTEVRRTRPLRQAAILWKRLGHRRRGMMRSMVRALGPWLSVDFT